jgi:hypothetical protein
MKWILAKRIAALALMILGLAVVAGITVSSFVDYGRKSTDYVGCFAYDAMLVGFECQGFIASSFVSAWLNWPLWLLYSPIFAFSSIKAASIAVLVWSPFILYVVAARKVAIENA